MLESATTSLSQRDLRQRDLVPASELARHGEIVIGVGAIGRQVALQLASLGVPRLVLCDDDSVSEENLAPQGYRPDQLGLPKVNATADDCRRIQPAIEIVLVNHRFRRSSTKRLASQLECMSVFCCVDAIATRRMIWEAVRGVAAFFVDGRMSGEVIRILAADDPRSIASYGETLFSPDRAFIGPCTARSTIYSASIAAGLMVGQFTKHLRGLQVDTDITLNLLAAEWIVASTAPAIAQAE